jgi:hypothetical protein
VYINWADRDPTWGADVVAWVAKAPPGARPRLIVFGPHADLHAHREAKAAGLGPMIANSNLIAHLPDLLSEESR